MAKRISMLPTLVTRQLFKADPSGESTVTIRQATTEDAIDLGVLFETTTQEYDDAELGKSKVTRSLNVETLKMARAFRTLAGSNLVKTDADNKESPLFVFKETPVGPRPVSEFEFEQAWGYLSIEDAEDIYAQVVAVNPRWDPKRQGE